MLNIQIASLLYVVDNLEVVVDKKFNLISIRDTHPTTENKTYYKWIDDSNISNLIVMEFDDSCLSVSKSRITPPNEHQIELLIEDFKKIRLENKNPWIVHCTAGISRSSAVAILLSYIEDPKDYLDIFLPNRHHPNIRIINLGSKFLGYDGMMEDIYKKMEDFEKKNGSILF